MPSFTDYLNQLPSMTGPMPDFTDPGTAFGQIPGGPADAQPTESLRQMYLGMIQARNQAAMSRWQAQYAQQMGNASLAAQLMQHADSIDQQNQTRQQQAQQFAQNYGLQKQAQDFSQQMQTGQFGLQEAGVTGMYNGQQTLAGQLGLGNLDLERRRQAVSEATFLNQQAANPNNLIESALNQGSITPGGGLPTYEQQPPFPRPRDTNELLQGGQGQHMTGALDDSNSTIPGASKEFLQSIGADPSTYPGAQQGGQGTTQQPDGSVHALGALPPTTIDPNTTKQAEQALGGQFSGPPSAQHLAIMQKWLQTQDMVPAAARADQAKIDAVRGAAAHYQMVLGGQGQQGGQSPADAYGQRIADRWGVGGQGTTQSGGGANPYLNPDGTSTTMKMQAPPVTSPTSNPVPTGATTLGPESLGGYRRTSAGMEQQPAVGANPMGGQGAAMSPLDRQVPVAGNIANLLARSRSTPYGQQAQSGFMTSLDDLQHRSDLRLTPGALDARGLRDNMANPTATGYLNSTLRAQGQQPGDFMAAIQRGMPRQQGGQMRSGFGG